MLIEHLIYSAALAVIVGMIYVSLTGRGPSWIIIAVAFIPDIDFGLDQLSKIPGITLSFTVRHGNFHNIMALVFSPLLLLRLHLPSGYGLRMPSSALQSGLDLTYTKMR